MASACQFLVFQILVYQSIRQNLLEFDSPLDVYSSVSEDQGPLRWKVHINNHRNNYREVFWKIADKHLWWRTFKNTYAGVNYLVKLQAIGLQFYWKQTPLHLKYHSIMQNVTMGFDDLLRSFTKQQEWWVFYSQYELRNVYIF